MSANVAFSEGTAQLFLDDCKPYLAHLKNSFKQKILSNKEHLETASTIVVDRIIDEIVLECVADFHRAGKLEQTKIFFGHLEDSESKSKAIISEESDKDKKNEDINCPNCQKLIHASRFASHLEKCMVQGRSSSRIASQRRANNSKECSYTGDDDDEDDFWKLNKSKNTKKVDGKKKKDNVRRAKPFRVDSPKGAKEGGNSSSNSLKEEVESPGKLSRESSSSSLAGKDGNGENESWISPNKMTLGEDKAAQLMAVRCGVKSDHTGKFCGRSLRCPLHSDAERADARKNMISEPNSNWESVVEVDEDTNKSELSNFSSLINITSATTPRKKDKKKVGFPKMF